MATIADISSGDFVYNTFDYRDPTKIGPAAWTTVYLLNLKPTDYIVDTSILKNNLFEISTTVLGAIEKKKIDQNTIAANTGNFSDKIAPFLNLGAFMFRVRSKNGWVKVGGGPNVDLYEREDKIALFAKPVTISDGTRPIVGKYEDYTLTPSKLHDVYRFGEIAYNPTVIMEFKKNTALSQDNKYTHFDQIDDKGNLVQNGTGIIICQHGRTAEVKAIWQDDITGKTYETIFFKDDIEFQVDPHTGIITTWVTVTTGQSTQIGQAATTSSLTEAITGKLYDISAATVRLEAEEAAIKKELSENLSKMEQIEKEQIILEDKNKKLDAKDAQLEQKDIDLKKEIDTKVDQTWIDGRMKDISAIEILDTAQQGQIDTLIAEEEKSDAADVIHTRDIAALLTKLEQEVKDRELLNTKHSTLRTDHTNLKAYAEDVKRIHDLLDTRTTNTANATTKFLTDISSSLLQRDTLNKNKILSNKQEINIINSREQTRYVQTHIKIDDISKNAIADRLRLNTIINNNYATQRDNLTQEITIRGENVTRIDKEALALAKRTTDLSNNVTKFLKDISSSIIGFKAVELNNLKQTKSTTDTITTELAANTKVTNENKANITTNKSAIDNDKLYNNNKFNKIDVSFVRITSDIKNQRVNILDITQSKRSELEKIVDISHALILTKIKNEIKERKDLSQNNIDLTSRVSTLETDVPGNFTIVTQRIRDKHSYVIDMSAAVWLAIKDNTTKRNSKNTEQDAKLIQFQTDIKNNLDKTVNNKQEVNINKDLLINHDASLNEIFDAFKLQNTADVSSFAGVNNTINNVLKVDIATNAGVIKTNKNIFDVSLNDVYKIGKEQDTRIINNRDNIVISNVNIGTLGNILTETNKTIQVLESEKVDVNKTNISENKKELIFLTANLNFEKSKNANVKNNIVTMVTGNSWQTDKYSEFEYVNFKNKNTMFETGFFMDSIRTGTTTGDNNIIVRRNGEYISVGIKGDISLNNTGTMLIKDNMISDKHIKTTNKIKIRTKTTLGIGPKLQWNKDIIELAEDYIKTSGFNTIQGAANADGFVGLNIKGADGTGDNVLINLHSNLPDKYSTIEIGTNISNNHRIYYQKDTKALCFTPTITGKRDLGVSLAITKEGRVAIGTRPDKLWQPEAYEALTVFGNIKSEQDVIIGRAYGIKYNRNDKGNILIGNGTRYIPNKVSGALSLTSNGVFSLASNIIQNKNISNGAINIEKVDINFGRGLTWNSSTQTLTAQGETIINDNTISPVKLQTGIPMSKTLFNVDTDQLEYNSKSSKLSIKDIFILREGGEQRLYEDLLIQKKVAAATSLKIITDGKEAGITLDNKWQIFTRQSTQNFGFYKNGSNAGIALMFDGKRNIGIGYDPSEKLLKDALPKDIIDINSEYKLAIYGNTFINGDLVINDGKGIQLFNNNTSGNLLIADGTRFTSQTMTGDATINSVGRLQITADKISDGMINSSANIQVSKLALTQNWSTNINGNIIGVNASNVLTTYDTDEYQVGKDKIQSFSFKQSNLYFDPKPGTVKERGGNRRWVIHHQHSPTGDIDALNSFGIYPVKKITDSKEEILYSRGINIRWTSGQLEVNGGIRSIGSDAFNWGNQNTFKYVKFEKANPTPDLEDSSFPTAFFEKGFFINTNSFTPGVSHVLDFAGDGDMIIRRNNFFRPVTMTGAINISSLGVTTISDNVIVNDHFSLKCIKDKNIADDANIAMSKINLKLGTGLTLAADGSLIVAAGGGGGGSAASIQASAFDSNYFILNAAGKLTIKDLFIKNDNDGTGQKVLGDIGVRPFLKSNGEMREDLTLSIFTNKFTGQYNPSLKIGSSIGFNYQFYTSTLLGHFGLWCNKTVLEETVPPNGHIFTIDNGNGNMGIQTGLLNGLAKSNMKLHVGGNIKCDGDLYLDKPEMTGPAGITPISRGIITYSNQNGKLLIADGTKFKPLSVIGDIEITTTAVNGKMMIRNGKIDNNHIKPSAGISLNKTAITVGNNLEINTNEISVKNNRFVRNPIQYGTNWSFDSTESNNKGSLTITSAISKNNFFKVYTNAADDNNSSLNYAGIMVGRSNSNHWELYQQKLSHCFGLWRPGGGPAFMINPTTRNISIGYSGLEATTPPEKLSVKGNIKIGGIHGLDISNNGGGWIKMANNTAGRLLVSDGTHFISQSIGGAITVNGMGTTSYVNKSITNAAINDTAQIRLSKLDFIPKPTQMQITNGNTLEIKPVFLKNTGTPKLAGVLRVDHNGLGIAIHSTKEEGELNNYGAYMSFHRNAATWDSGQDKFIGGARSAYIGFTSQPNSAFRFKNEVTGGLFEFNKKIKLLGDLHLAQSGTGIDMVDNTLNKVLGSNGSKYVPRHIKDCMVLGENLTWINDGTIWRLHANSGAGAGGAMTNNGIGINLTLKPNDQLPKIAMTIVSKNKSTDTNNAGAMIAFRKESDSVGDDILMGFDNQKTGKFRTSFKFLNNASSTFLFDASLKIMKQGPHENGARNITLSCNNYHPTKAGHRDRNGIIWEPNYENVFSKRSAGIFFTPEGNSYRGGLAFCTNNKLAADINTGDFTERMRIDMDGNIGINRSTSIRYPLHIGSFDSAGTTSYNSKIKRLGISTHRYGGDWEWNIKDYDSTVASLNLQLSSSEEVSGTVKNASPIGVTYLANDNSFKVGINNKYPRQTFSVSSHIDPTKINDSTGSTEMSIIGPGDGSKAILYFGTPTREIGANAANSTPSITNEESALKAAIIAEGLGDGNSRCKLHFCLNNSLNNPSANDAQVTQSKMTILPSGRIGIGTTSPTSLLHVHQNTSATPMALFSSNNDLSARIYGTNKSYLEIANSSTQSGGTNKSWMIGLNDGDNTLGLGYRNDNGSLTSSNSFLNIKSDGKIGIGKINPQYKCDIFGFCRASKFIGDGSLLTGVQTTGAVEQMHNHHKGTPSTFLCKFLCAGNFSSTQQHPIKSLANIKAEETGTTVTNAVSFPQVTSTGNRGVVRAFHARRWADNDKAFKITNLTGSSSAFHDKYTIIMDVNLQDYGFQGWTSIANINYSSAIPAGTDDAEIYFLDGKPNVMGSAVWSGLLSTDALDLNKWYTIAFTIDMTYTSTVSMTAGQGDASAVYKYYINGLLKGTRGMVAQYDGAVARVIEYNRMKLRNSVYLFNERFGAGVGTDAYTGKMYVKNIEIHSRVLTDAEMLVEFSRGPLKMTSGKNIFSHTNSIAVIEEKLSKIKDNAKSAQWRSDNEETIIKELKEKDAKLEERLASAEKKIEELIKINKDLMEIMKNK